MIPSKNRWPIIFVAILGVIFAGWHVASRAAAGTKFMPDRSPLTHRAASCTSPDLIYSTIVGDGLVERGNGVVLADDGVAFTVGTTESFDFPTGNSFNASMVDGVDSAEHGIDVFMLQVNADASNLDSVLWISPDGENDQDFGQSIGRDDAGNIYFAGQTYSADLCTPLGNPGGYDTEYSGNGDGYIIKVEPDGVTPVYCTFIGSDELERLNDIAVAPNGEVYATGGTWSPDFPATTYLVDENLDDSQRDLFMIKLDASGNNLVYSTVMGGERQEEGLSIDITPAGEAVATGWVFSADFPTTRSAYDTEHNGGVDVFVTKLDATTGEPLYSTFLGGDGEDRGYALATLDSGEVVLGGITGSANLPTTPNAIDSALNTDGLATDAFVAALSSDGTTLTYGTFLGGDGIEQIDGLVVKQNKTIYAAGYTESADFPVTTNAIDPVFSGNSDAFLLRFDVGASELTYSSFWGGDAEDRAFNLAVDEVGTVYMVGETRSADFCITPNAFDSTPNGDHDVFISKLLAGDPLEPPDSFIFLPILSR